MTKIHRNKLPKKKNMKDKDIFECGLLDQDEYFYFIAGYTPNGFPYGITWEEYESERHLEEHNDINEFISREEDFYYIAGYSESGEIIGITWDEYLWTLKEEDTYTMINQSQEPNPDD